MYVYPYTYTKIKILDPLILILNSVYIGHSKSNSFFYANWTIFAYRQNINLINLRKTIMAMRCGMYGAMGFGKASKPMWFVNLYAPFSTYTQTAAYNCGEFFATKFWIVGLVSNYRHINYNACRLYKIPIACQRKKEVREYEHFKNWYFTRFSWPRCLFMGSIYWTHFVTKETSDGRVGCVGLADTNSSAWLTNMAVAANDDSLESVVFFNDLFSLYVLTGKFRSVLKWYFHIRAKTRAGIFARWTREQDREMEHAELIEQLRLKYKLNEDKKENLINAFYGLNIFFSRNYIFRNIKEGYKTYYPKEYLTDKDFFTSLNIKDVNLLFSSFNMSSFRHRFRYKLSRVKSWYLFRWTYLTFSFSNRKFFNFPYVNQYILGEQANNILAFTNIHYKLYVIIKYLKCRFNETSFINLFSSQAPYFSVISNRLFPMKKERKVILMRNRFFSFFSFLTHKRLDKIGFKKLLKIAEVNYSSHLSNFFSPTTWRFRRGAHVYFNDNSFRFFKREIEIFRENLRYKIQCDFSKFLLFDYSHYYIEESNHRFVFPSGDNYNSERFVKHWVDTLAGDRLKYLHFGFLIFKTTFNNFYWFKNNIYIPNINFILFYRNLWNRLFRFCTIYNSFFLEKKLNSILKAKLKSRRFFNSIWLKLKWRKRKNVKKLNLFIKKEIKYLNKRKHFVLLSSGNKFRNYKDIQKLKYKFYRRNRFSYKKFYKKNYYKKQEVHYKMRNREYDLFCFFWEIPNFLYKKRKRNLWFVV